MSCVQSIVATLSALKEKLIADCETLRASNEGLRDQNNALLKETVDLEVRTL